MSGPVGICGWFSAALSASLEEASLYHQDGLLIVHWGARRDATAALSGHFAFALLDEVRAEALPAVNRCATRPLFYQMAGRSLLFASSSEALARHPGAGRDVDPQALFDYLYLRPAAIRLPSPCCSRRAWRARRRILRREFVDQLLARHLPENPAAHGETVWRLLMLEQWLARGRRGGFGPGNGSGAAQLPASASYTAR